MKVFTVMFVAAVLAARFTMVPSAEAKSSVDIINALQEVLWVHCKSADNDLQWQQLQVSQDYHFEFNQNILGSTLFWCRFTWGPNFMYWQEFTVWDQMHYWTMPLDCINCIWEAQSGGMYIWDKKTQTYNFWKPWNTNGPATFANDTNPPATP